VFDGKTQQNKWAYGPGFGSAVDIGDVSGDGVAKIVGLIPGGPARVFDAVAKSPVVGNSRRNSGFFGAESGRPRWRQAGRDHRR